MKKEKNTIDLGTLIRNACWFASILFIALRCTGVIDWAWYWLVMPIVGCWALGVLLLALVGIGSYILEDKEDG